MKTLSILAIAALTSCASTSLYRDGKLVAHFEGDMASLHYRDGLIELSGDINHSAATKAQGESATNKINAIGTGLIGLGAGALLVP